MKVLYFTDGYTYKNMGTKRSLFEEVQRRGNEMVWMNIRQITEILSLIEEHKPNQVWLAHSNLMLPDSLRKQIYIPIVGFGFSDPYYFSPERFLSYDVYVTNHIYTFEKYRKEIPVIYNPTACDFRFHNRNPKAEKLIDISIIGLGQHPRFKNKVERVEVVDKLRKVLGKYSIQVYGRAWPKHTDNHSHIEGSEFLKVIQSSKIGLDIQDEDSPMAHRMFEYAGCGVPVITRRRPEVFKFFKEEDEILTYSTHEELLEKVKYYLQHPSELDEVGMKAWTKCTNYHNISHRVDHLISELGKIILCM